jgi:hypothetical protein
LRKGPLHTYLRHVEIEVIHAALVCNGWNVAATARVLGVSRVGLSKRLVVLGLERPEKIAASKPQGLPWPCPKCEAAAAAPCVSLHDARARAPHWERRRAFSAAGADPADADRRLKQ